MEFLCGIRGKDFVLLASDLLSIRSIMVLSHDESKFSELSPTLLFTCVGEAGEASRLRERLVAESNLATLRMNGRQWTPVEAAHFSRSLVAASLRTRSPYNVNLLLAGLNSSDNSGELYWLDYLGTLQTLPFAFHGYGAYFSLGLLDSKYTPNITIDEAIKLVFYVVNEMQTRFVVQMPKLEIRLIDSSGTHQISVDNWRTDPLNISWNRSLLLSATGPEAVGPRATPIMEVD